MLGNANPQRVWDSNSESAEFLRLQRQTRSGFGIVNINLQRFRGRKRRFAAVQRPRRRIWRQFCNCSRKSAAGLGSRPRICSRFGVGNTNPQGFNDHNCEFEAVFATAAKNLQRVWDCSCKTAGVSGQETQICSGSMIAAANLVAVWQLQLQICSSFAIAAPNPRRFCDRGGKFAAVA